MVRGVGKFKEYFKNYTGKYSVIGGAACDILLGNIGENFRATKDLDIVLMLEETDENFVNAFTEFVEAGGYEHIDKGTGESQFFRFSKPKDISFPYMIELFSRRPSYVSSLVTRLAPIHISDDVISLSAILLDNDYFDLLRTGVKIIDEISVLDLEYIILFKMKAWIDLSNRKSNGEPIDSRNIKKHRNDIFRLAASIDKDSHISIAGQVKIDAEIFINKVKDDSVDLKSLNIRNTSYDELLDNIVKCYNISRKAENTQGFVIFLHENKCVYDYEQMVKIKMR